MSTELVEIKERNMLVESRLYALNMHTPFLKFLEPDITTLMQIENLFDAEYKRKDDEQKTRIFINFTNLNGNGNIFVIEDEQRLARTFDIDDFITKMYAAVNRDFADDNVSLDLLGPTIVNGLNTTIMNALELSVERQPESVKLFSQVATCALVSVLLNDPLDAIITLKEQPLRDGETETDAVITGFWTIKSRDNMD